jgi:hypothetical protein
MSEKYRTTSFFNGVSSFKAAFPQLADAVVESKERRGPEDTAQAGARKTGFRRGNFTQGVLPCSNPACHEGGYQIDRLIAEMVQLGETERVGTMLCSGREVGEEVRRGPVRCPYRIEFRATLSPKTDDTRPERRSFQRRGRHRSSRRNTAA